MQIWNSAAVGFGRPQDIGILRFPGCIMRTEYWCTALAFDRLLLS
jgi:hypothetical protein